MFSTDVSSTTLVYSNLDIPGTATIPRPLVPVRDKAFEMGDCLPICAPAAGGFWRPCGSQSHIFVERLKGMVSARRNFQDYATRNGEGNSLLQILISRRGLGVTDARDMIYGHLGIVSDVLSSEVALEVDYSKTCERVSIDVACYFMEIYRDY